MGGCSVRTQVKFRNRHVFSSFFLLSLLSLLLLLPRFLSLTLVPPPGGADADNTHVVCLRAARARARNRCPLLAIPTAIIYAVQESHGMGAVFPRVTGCAVLLLSFVVASRRVLPLAMQRLVLKDKKKVR